MSAEPLYIQLTWEEPSTREVQRPLLAAPVAIGRELDQMPEELGGQAVSRLVLDDRQVSRFHALITVSGADIYVEDRSANGTFLNGQMIRGGKQLFSNKDTLRIGPYKITAMLMREDDLNATELNPREHTSFERQEHPPHRNTMLIWTIGGVLLLLMAVGGWALVSMLLSRSRPQLQEAPEPTSQHLLWQGAIADLRGGDRPLQG